MTGFAGPHGMNLAKASPIEGVIDPRRWPDTVPSFSYSGRENSRPAGSRVAATGCLCGCGADYYQTANN